MKTHVNLRGRDFLRVRDFTREELESVLDLADELKANPQPLLPQKTLGLVFGQPSTRTRISFATAKARRVQLPISSLSRRRGSIQRRSLSG